MQTDIPLKRLTLLRPADLLPLLGSPNAQVLAVETLELPASATRLDNVLRLRSPQGQEYLHLIEWQGYHDPTVLWRVAGYLAWLGQRYASMPVVGTLIYLTPADDVGDTLRQAVDRQVVLEWAIPCLRLWEQDAAKALMSGKPGLVALSPLMRNASAALAEQAAAMLLSQTAMPQQADLLSILGVFAEPLLAHEYFVRLVGKDKLVESKLLEYLAGEKVAMLEAKLAGKEAELVEKAAELAAAKATQEAATVHRLQDTLEALVIARFPQAPIALVRDIRRVGDPDTLQQLMVAMVQVTSLSELERLLAGAAPLD